MRAMDSDRESLGAGSGKGRIEGLTEAIPFVHTGSQVPEELRSHTTYPPPQQTLPQGLWVLGIHQ